MNILYSSMNVFHILLDLILIMLNFCVRVVISTPPLKSHTMLLLSHEHDFGATSVELLVGKCLGETVCGIQLRVNFEDLDLA